MGGGRLWWILQHTTLSFSVRRILGGGVPAGLVGGRHTQPGSTCTPSPARGSGTWRSRLDRGAKALLPLGADAGNVGHGRCGSFPASGLDRQIARNPRRPAVPSYGGDVLWTACCSMEVTIRRLWGDKQPSRLTCSVTGQIGASYPAGAVPLCQGPHQVPDRAHAVRMWALLSGAPACPSAPWESGSSGRFRD